MRNLVKIKDTLDKLIYLLDRECSQDWKRHFVDVRNQMSVVNTDSDLKKWVRRITGVYGGMGSFNDLVLSEGWKPLKEENRKLEKLKEILLEEALNLIEVKSEQ